MPDIGKQKEIREGLDKVMDGFFDKYGELQVSDDEMLDNIFSYLHSQGVVIKVDKELPEIRFNRGFDTGKNLRIVQGNMLKAGYVATIPIKEG